MPPGRSTGPCRHGRMHNERRFAIARSRHPVSTRPDAPVIVIDMSSSQPDQPSTALAEGRRIYLGEERGEPAHTAFSDRSR